jgi:hypothetical protein
MIETQEDIQFTLEMAGETITFNTFSLQAIPGDLVYNVQSYDSPYDLEKQDIDFRISYRDCLDNLVDSKDQFNYTLPNTDRTIRYEVMAYTVDTTGWVNLKVKPLI